jgi:hypothetical protein
VFVLNWFPQAGMRRVVVIALTAERIPAALRAAVRTDRRSTVTALRHGSLAAWHTYVAITGDIFNLAGWIHVDSVATSLSA